jgi:hypothetical protein
LTSGGENMKFIEFIEFETDDIGAFQAEVDRWV